MKFFSSKNFHCASSIHYYFCFQTYSKVQIHKTKQQILISSAWTLNKNMGKFSMSKAQTRRHSAVKLLCLFALLSSSKGYELNFYLYFFRVLWINKNVTSALMCAFTKEWIFWHRWKLFFSLTSLSFMFSSSSLFLFLYIFRDLPSLKKIFFYLYRSFYFSIVVFIPYKHTASSFHMNFMNSDGNNALHYSNCTLVYT